MRQSPKASVTLTFEQTNPRAWKAETEHGNYWVSQGNNRWYAEAGETFLGTRSTRQAAMRLCNLHLSRT